MSVTDWVVNVCLRREKGKKRRMGREERRKERRNSLNFFDKIRENYGIIFRVIFIIRISNDYTFKGSMEF